jgi:tRNA-binding protein
MTPAPVKPAISIELLNQVDIRVGTIRSVADVSGSDKLVQLRVSFGDHERTIVAGLKQERANPQELEGKQALFVVNLEARKMRGVISEGMLFDIGYADRVTPVLAVPQSPVPEGTRAG